MHASVGDLCKVRAEKALGIIHEFDGVDHELEGVTRGVF